MELQNCSAEVMSKKNAVFTVRFQIEACSTGENGSLVKTSSIKRSTLGKKAPRQMDLQQIPEKRENCIVLVASEIAATCTLRELRPSPKSRPV